MDAAGTMSAWSLLYLLTNGVRRTVGPIYKAGAVLPALMGGKMLFDAATNGWYWMNTRRWEEDGA